MSVNTYAIEFFQVLLIVLSELFDTMWVLEHVEAIDNVELDLAKVAQVVCLLLAAAALASLLHLL